MIMKLSLRSLRSFACPTKPWRRRVAIVSITLAVSTACGAVVQDFARYEVILERRPFGEAPSESEHAEEMHAAVPVGPSFVDSLSMCAITAGGGAMRVGFVDTKAKPPRTYFLFVGESEDGIEVVEVDYEAETALLRKGGEERILRMAGSIGSAAMSSGSDETVRRKPGFSRLRRARIKRTREEIEEQRQREIERKSPILKGKEYEDHIRQYNMDVIRSGAPALPIALTPDEDAQLVDEGVLDAPGE